MEEELPSVQNNVISQEAAKSTFEKTGLFLQDAREMWKPEHLILWALQSTSPVALVHVPGEGVYLSFLLNFCPAVLKFVKKP